VIAALAAVAVLACGAALERLVRRRHAGRVRRRVPRRERGSAPAGMPGFDHRFSTPNAMRALGPPSWLGPMLVDAAIPVSAFDVWRAWLLGCVLALALGALLGGPVLAVGAFAGAAGAPVVVLRSMRGRAAERAEAGLPGALEEIARGLRSGGSLRQAVACAAEASPGILGEELARVALAAGQGMPLVEALEDCAGRSPRPGVRLAVAALSLGAETGGAQARAVDGVAATLRERLAVAAEVRALSSQTRASMLVIALSPLAFCAFASATDHRTSTFLFRTPFGVACLAAGIGLDVAGAAWMRRLCRVPA
jgi:tight adherence protein B